MDIATNDPLLDGLNAAQHEAVLRVAGPLLVLAGAGSGKTRVLTTRLARLIDHHGVDPSRILAVTFTNKAAGEMKERIARLLGRAPTGMWVGTFHAIGARMLRGAPHLVGRTPSFTIYDQDDTQSVIKRIMDRHKLNTKQFTRPSPTPRTRSFPRTSTRTWPSTPSRAPSRWSIATSARTCASPTPRTSTTCSSCP
jgi:DNA helicase-2/ATP-dependent DNA helicase PcrA